MEKDHASLNGVRVRLQGELDALFSLPPSRISVSGLSIFAHYDRLGWREVTMKFNGPISIEDFCCRLDVLGSRRDREFRAMPS
ncbi:hypothetical protein CDAR_415521 [Caerostris darwini]|uniref:Uncharacterized protein n=1 Tax=Caerostris darwini TaxID=1538125 RepID=A0AAV4Q0R0_9ARAC|nr:hypothetical protein CDAR_415521 [Caerostris darwini]